jgi:Peptidase C13 family
MGSSRVFAWIPVSSRLLTLRKQIVDIPSVATDGAVIACALVSLALWIGLDYRRAGAGARFEPTALAIIALYACAVLGVAFALARSLRPRTHFRCVLFAVVALLPVVIAAGFIIDVHWDRAAARVACGLVVLYGLAYLANAMRLLTGAFQPRAALVLVVALAALFPLARIADLSPWLWTPAASADEASEADDSQVSPLVAESLLFDERAQIDDAVDAMSPGLDSSPAIYFVGFAGVAEQHVFAEEIKLAARIVDERFGTSGHQLLLINDRRDIDTYPIATASGLAYALRAIGAKMNPDRDILFLAISSHGAADASVSVSNGGLQLEQLSDEDLAAALKDSGIKRRIIVISACYAGAFIQPLEDPDTVVIAAAAPDKTSFGCSDDRDLTYFGEAFYRDALPHAKTLQEAFTQAKAAIAAREREEHETPSEPQAYFGTQISAVLERNPMRIEPRGVGLRAQL